jgi:hypothetical protein
MAAPPLRVALVALVALAILCLPTAAAKRGKRLRDGDRAACACHPAGYVVSAAERSCANEEYMLELCTAEELAAVAASGGGGEDAQSSTDPPPPPPPPPPEEAAGSEAKPQTLSPRQRAELVEDMVVRVDTAAALSGLVAAHTVVLLTVGTATEAKPCKPCGVLAPNLKLCLQVTAERRSQRQVRGAAASRNCCAALVTVVHASSR